MYLTICLLLFAYKWNTYEENIFMYSLHYLMFAFWNDIFYEIFYIESKGFYIIVLSSVLCVYTVWCTVHTYIYS